MHASDLYALNPRQRGMSIVELMVAVAIGMIMILGVTQLFISSKQSYRIQESMGYLQENARFSMQVLDYGIRMADHWGGVPADKVSGAPSGLTGISGSVCTSSWIANPDEGVRGYEGGSSSPLNCIADADHVDNSDILVVRYADPAFVTNATLGGSPGTDVFVRTTIGKTGTFANGGNATIGALADEDGIYNYPFHIDVYFLRPCSDKAGSTCASTDDDGDPIPTLTRLSLVNGALVQQPLIEDVEQLQFEYGLDIDSDFTADLYATATTVNSSYDWDDVVSVRASFVVRSNATDISLPSGSTDFTMAGGYTHSVTNDDHRRRLFTHVIQVRNRTRG